MADRDIPAFRAGMFYTREEVLFIKDHRFWPIKKLAEKMKRDPRSLETFICRLRANPTSWGLSKDAFKPMELLLRKNKSMSNAEARIIYDNPRLNNTALGLKLGRTRYFVRVNRARIAADPERWGIIPNPNKQ